MSLREEIEKYTLRIEGTAAAEGLVQTAANMACELDLPLSMIPPAAQTMLQAATTLLDGARELISASLKESKEALQAALREVGRLESPAPPEGSSPFSREGTPERPRSV